MEMYLQSFLCFIFFVSYMTSNNVHKRSELIQSTVEGILQIPLVSLTLRQDSMIFSKQSRVEYSSVMSSVAIKEQTPKQVVQIA